MNVVQNIKLDVKSCRDF